MRRFGLYFTGDRNEGLMFKLKRTGLKHFRFLFLPIILLALSAAAQPGTGCITGTVEDQSGLPVGGAEVFVYGSDIRDITGSSGSYTLSGVVCASPRYIVCAVKDGSITAFEGNIDVSAGGTTVVDLVLAELEESNSHRSQLLQVKMGYVIDRIITVSDTLQPDENAVLNPSLYPDSVTVYMLPGEHIDPTNPVVAAIANNILMSIPEPLRTNQTEVARRVYIWVVTHTHYDLMNNYPDDLTCGNWQTVNGGWGLNFNDWCYKPSEVVEEERSICIEFERLTSSLLRALEIPARPSPLKAHPVTQWWVQLADGTGYWANMETSGGSTEYWETGDSLACFPDRPEHKILFTWPNADAPIHMNWDSGYDHLWQERSEQSTLQRNPANLALAMIMLDEFEQYGTAFTSGSQPGSGEPNYEVYFKGFDIDLASMESGQEITVWFPVFPTTQYNEVLDWAVWTSHPEWVTNQWVETLYDSTSGRSLDIQYISLHLTGSSEQSIDLLNGGFEEGGAQPSNWTPAASPPGSAVFDRSSVSHTGSWSAHITGLMPSTQAAYIQTLAVEPGQHVRLNGWVKRDLNSPIEKVCLKMFFSVDGTPGGLVTANLSPVNGANEQGWTWVNGGATVPEGADSVAILCSIDGLSEAWFDDIRISVRESGTSGMENEEWQGDPSLSVCSVLHQNYPNPFTTTTIVDYEISNDSQITLELYDISGRMVRTLVRDYLPAGKHSIEWDGNDDSGINVASGVYFCRLETADRSTQARKLMLLR